MLIAKTQLYWENFGKPRSEWSTETRSEKLKRLVRERSSSELCDVNQAKVLLKIGIPVHLIHKMTRQKALDVIKEHYHENNE